MSEYIMLGAEGEAICEPPCRTGATCMDGRCVRPAKAPPPPPPTDFDIPPEDEFNDLYDNGNGNGAGSNFFVYGSIFLLLAAAGGGYYYWYHWKPAQEEEEEE